MGKIETDYEQKLGSRSSINAESKTKTLEDERRQEAYSL
jgi:hypothetical protein